MNRKFFVRSALLVLLAGCDVGRGEDPSRERMGEPAQPEPPRREPPVGEFAPDEEAEGAEGVGGEETEDADDSRR